MPRQVHVRVPATSANLGSGFDSIGLALDYCDELVFTRNDDKGDDTSAHVIIHGEGEETLPRDETHLVVSMFRQASRTFGLPRFGFTLEAHNRIPQARGMGSSAEAIVAGVAAAAAFAGRTDKDSIFMLAAAAEGHPDNVAPAVYGGLTASWRQEASEGTGSFAIAGAEPLQAGFHSVGYPVSPHIRASVFIPDFELSTERARRALPAKVPYSSAVFNISRAALLPAAMNCEDAARGNQLLFAATQDMLHQPYRKTLMTASWQLIESLRAHGFSAAVSGAGPCVMVLYYGHDDDQIDEVAAPQLNDGHWRVLHLPVQRDGVCVEVR